MYIRERRRKELKYGILSFANLMTHHFSNASPTSQKEKREHSLCVNALLLGKIFQKIILSRIETRVKSAYTETYFALLMYKKRFEALLGTSCRVKNNLNCWCFEETSGPF